MFQREAEFSFELEIKTDILIEKSSRLLEKSRELGGWRHTSGDISMCVRVGVRKTIEIPQGVGRTVE